MNNQDNEVNRSRDDSSKKAAKTLSSGKRAPDNGQSLHGTYPANLDVNPSVYPQGGRPYTQPLSSNIPITGASNIGTQPRFKYGRGPQHAHSDQRFTFGDSKPVDDTEDDEEIMLPHPAQISSTRAAPNARPTQKRKAHFSSDAGDTEDDVNPQTMNKRASMHDNRSMVQDQTGQGERILTDIRGDPLPSELQSGTQQMHTPNAASSVNSIGQADQTTTAASASNSSPNPPKIGRGRAGLISAAKLATLPILRAIPYRTAEISEEGPKESAGCARGQLIAERGHIEPQPCDFCMKGRGPFNDCFMVHSTLGSTVACANCTYQGKKCSLT